jgi:hypothetical protein
MDRNTRPLRLQPAAARRLGTARCNRSPYRRMKGFAMARYLLVAHQTADRPELQDAARELAEADDQARFTLLVPATPVGDLMMWEEGETKDVAKRRAESAAAALRRSGLNVLDARIGDADPVLAVDDEFLAGNRYDAIVISTFPPGLSRWIKMDVVSRLRRKRPHLRLIHITPAEPEASTPGARGGRREVS